MHFEQVMLKNLTAAAFAAVQSKLFPIYFLFQVVLLLNMNLARLSLSGIVDTQTKVVFGAALASLVNYSFLGPKQMCVMT